MICSVTLCGTIVSYNVVESLNVTVCPKHTLMGEIINNLSYGGLQPELRVHVHNVSYGSLQPELQVRFNIDNVSYGSINLISNSDPVTHIVIIITTFQQNYINNVSYGSIFKDIMCL